MIDDKIAKAKALIEERERIDRELSALFGLADAPKRGRPRKGQSITTTTGQSETDTTQ
jgi:hypothetical protein